MTKETKEKIEITLEIYNNVKAMIKSSNTEDFFIAVKMWFAMDPPLLLSVILKKHAYKSKAAEFNSYMTSPFDHWNQNLTWPAILERVGSIDSPRYDKYKDIIEQEFNAFINQKLMNEGIGKNIKKIKTEIKWQN